MLIAMKQRNDSGGSAPELQTETQIPGEIRCGMLFLQTEDPLFMEGKQLLFVLSKEGEYWRFAQSIWVCDECWSGFCLETNSGCPIEMTEDEIRHWRWGRLRYCGMMPTLAQLEEAAR